LASTHFSLPSHVLWLWKMLSFFFFLHHSFYLKLEAAAGEIVDHRDVTA
jgi:hypothetical protein